MIAMPPYRRGDIFFADLSPVIGSEQGGGRPVLIVQNDLANRHSPTVVVAVFTSKLSKPDLPTHVTVHPDKSGLRKTSLVLAEQLRTIDKSRLGKYIGHLEEELMESVDRALEKSLALE